MTSIRMIVILEKLNKEFKVLCVYFFKLTLSSDVVVNPFSLNGNLECLMNSNVYYAIL